MVNKIRVKIRRAKLKDINEIYSIGICAKELEFSKDMNFHEKAELKEFINHPKDNILIVAVVEKKVVGFTFAKIVSTSWCMLDNMVIEDKFRDNGIGSLFLEELYSILKREKIGYIQILEEIHHKKTRDFWKKKGFHEEKKFIWADKKVNV